MREQQEGTDPDPRFTLANERTYLAYLRTALACYAGGLSAAQFLTIDGDRSAGKAIAVVLVLAGIVTTAGAFRRWQSNLSAMRRGEPLASSPLPLVLAATISVVGLGGLLFALLR